MESTEQPASTRNYFLTKNETIPNNYIKFKDIEMSIRNQNPCNYDLVYFQITNKPTSSSVFQILILKMKMSLMIK